MLLNWDAARTIAAGTSDEPLVSGSSCAHWHSWPSYFKRGVHGSLPEIWVRQGVCERLILAARALTPKYRLVVLDGWRPKSVQHYLFEEMRANIAAANPGLSDIEVENRVLVFVARASDDPTCPSPHITGGAVDVTLADSDGQFVDMGSAFDEASERSWTSAPVEAAAKENRRRLLDAMQQAGFTNLPSEWWHFDYGNWLWALYNKYPSAVYGPTQLA